MPYILFTRRPFCYWSLLQWSLIRDPLYPGNHSTSLYELIRFRHLYTSCVIFHSETLAAFRFERTLCAVTRYWLSYPEPLAISGAVPQLHLVTRLSLCSNDVLLPARKRFRFRFKQYFQYLLWKNWNVGHLLQGEESIRKSTELTLILLNLGSIKHCWIHWSNTKGNSTTRKC